MVPSSIVVDWMDILIYMTAATLDMCKALLVTMFDISGRSLQTQLSM